MGVESAGRVIAQKRKHRRTGNPRGGDRRSGTHDACARGEVAAVKALRDAMDKLGEQHPAVQRVLAELQKFQRAEPGYTGRYSVMRLQALTLELRLYLSDAPKRVELSGRVGLDQLVPPPDEPHRDGG